MFPVEFLGCSYSVLPRNVSYSARLLRLFILGPVWRLFILYPPSGFSYSVLPRSFSYSTYLFRLFILFPYWRLFILHPIWKFSYPTVLPHNFTSFDPTSISSTPFTLTT